MQQKADSVRYLNKLNMVFFWLKHLYILKHKVTNRGGVPMSHAEFVHICVEWS